MKKVFTLLCLVMVLGCSKSSDPHMDNEEQTDDLPETLVTSFTNVHPIKAFNQDIITIAGENIDTEANYNIKLGDVAAAVQTVTDSTITFAITEEMTDGIVSVTFEGEENILDPINILQENGVLYGILKENEATSSIVKIDIASGQIVETVLSGTDLNLKFVKLEYAPSINSLILICDSTNSQIQESYGILNLDNGAFTNARPSNWDFSSIIDLKITRSGRVFLNTGFKGIELDLNTGSVISDPLFYSYSGHPTLSALNFSEYEGLVAAFDLNDDFNIHYLNIYNLNTETASVINDRAMSQTIFNVNNGVGYSVNIYGTIYRKPAFLQPGTILFETGLENRSNYDRLTISHNSQRVFFVAEQPDNTSISYLCRYHTQTNSYNQVQLNKLLIDIQIAE